MSATPPRNHHLNVLPVSTPLRSVEPHQQSPRAPQSSPDHNQTSHISPYTEPCCNKQPHYDLSSICTSHTQPDISIGSENSPVDQHLADCSEPQPEECIPEYVVDPSSQEDPVSEESLLAPTGAEASPDILGQCSSHTSSSEVEAEPKACALASPVLMPYTPTKDLSVSAAVSNEVISACNGYAVLCYIKPSSS